ncbi:hypothetical protein BVX97_06070 [bacterium E08(2017)]|nr:hypothetical protein BVX97_06070 [bacterium E08(2017)]
MIENLEGQHAERVRKLKHTTNLLLIILGSFCAGFSTYGVADTITLQQGLNGYTGCSDTHIHIEWHTQSTANHGSSQTLQLLTEHYKST